MRKEDNILTVFQRIIDAQKEMMDLIIVLAERQREHSQALKKVINK